MPKMRSILEGSYGLDCNFLQSDKTIILPVYKIGNKEFIVLEKITNRLNQTFYYLGNIQKHFEKITLINLPNIERYIELILPSVEVGTVFYNDTQADIICGHTIRSNVNESTLEVHMNTTSSKWAIDSRHLFKKYILWKKTKVFIGMLRTTKKRRLKVTEIKETQTREVIVYVVDVESGEQFKSPLFDFIKKTKETKWTQLTLPL